MATRTRNDRETTRRIILDEAMKIALADGVLAVSGPRIAKATKLSPSLTSTHFDKYPPGHPEGVGSTLPNLYCELFREAMRLNKVRMCESLACWPTVDKHVVWPADILKEYAAWKRRRAST